MALSGGSSVFFGSSVDNASEEIEPIRWSDTSIPYLQFIELAFRSAEGVVFALRSDVESGLYLLELPSAPKSTVTESSSIYRVRVVSELPNGPAKIHLVHNTGSGVFEARVAVGSDIVGIVAGEVYEGKNGDLRVVTPDESLLVQLNGQKP